MKRILALALLVSGTSLATEVGNYPNAVTLTGTERLLADQAGTTSNITPLQIETYVCTLLPGACVSPLPVANGGTGVTSSTGTGNVVLSSSPYLTTPHLGIPANVDLTNASNLPTAAISNGNLPALVLSANGSAIDGIADSQTLTNKTISGSANTISNIQASAMPAFSGDCTTSAGATALTCLQTNGTAFGTFATQSYASPPIIGGTTPNGATFSYESVSGGVVPADTSASLLITGVQAASVSGGPVSGIKVNEVFVPTAAVGVNAIQLRPTLGTTSANIANYEGIFVPVMTIGANYTGTTPNITVYEADYVYTDNRTGGTASNPAQNFIQFLADPITNGTATTGAATNTQFLATSTTAYSAAGGTVNNAAFKAFMPNGGSTGGNTTNYGLYITGAGGTASGGTTTNWAIASTSTADSKMTGGLDYTPIGAISPQVGYFTLIASTGTISPGTYTIGTLPTCNSGSTLGAFLAVSNGVAAPTYLAVPSTTGTATQPVFCDGTSWKYH